MHVGTKELKNRLSHYLRLVRDGEVVRVTDRGRVVAELRAAPAEPAELEQQLRLLEGRGVVTVGTSCCDDFAPVRITERNRASGIILEERR